MGSAKPIGASLKLAQKQQTLMVAQTIITSAAGSGARPPAPVAGRREGRRWRLGGAERAPLGRPGAHLGGRKLIAQAAALLAALPIVRKLRARSLSVC